MMRWIVDVSMKASVPVLVIAAAMMFFGGRELRDAPVDTLPEFGPTTVEIQTEALGLSAAEVEQMVTVPLEADLLAGVAWLDVIKSESIPGLSSITLIFEPGTDVLRARQVVQERLTQAYALPSVSKAPVMLQPVSSTSRVMMIGLSSRDLSLIEMSVLARWTMRPRLLGVEGVANVAIWGQREQQLQVQVDPERMRERGVSLDEVVATAGNALWVSPLTFLEASSPGTGGFIDTPNQRLGIQHIQPITSPADLEQVPIEGKPDVRLADVATIAEDHQPLIGNAIVNDGPGLLLVVEKFPGANTLEVTREIDEALAALRPGLSGMEVDATVYRPATSIENGIDNLAVAALVGIVLAVAVFGVFFFGWRAALISLVAIPTSMMAAGLVLYQTGATFNVMVLAGLVVAVAVVVDDAILDVENIVRRLRQRRAEGSDESVALTILTASVEMRASVVIATVIVLLSVLPLFFLDGQAGEFFPPLALAYALAAMAALLVSLTVTPALAVLLFSGAPLPAQEPPPIRWLKRGYGVVLARFLRTPGAPYVAFAAIALVGLAALTQLDRPSLIPSLKEQALLVHWDGAPGTSQPEMSRIISLAGEELRAVPGVQNVGLHVGRAITSDQVVGINSGELWVSIDPDADYDETVAAVEEVVAGYPGLSRNVVSYSEESVREALAGADDDVTVRIYGEDADVLRSKAAEVQAAASQIDGVADAEIEFAAEEPTLEIEVDLAAAQRFGVRPGDIRRVAATLLSGIQVGSLFEEQKVFEVVVWSTPATRANLTSIRELPIETPDGASIRLQDVADVRIAANPNVIRREAVSRYIDVGVDVRGRGVDAVARDVERLVAEVEFPLEHHALLLGETEGRQTVENRGIALGIAAAIGILLLLQLTFGSWRLAAVSFLALPAALVGGVLAAWAAGGDLTIASYGGFLALLAIAARNSIVLIKHYQHLEKAEGESFGRALVLRGANERVSPTLMSAIATGVALVPLALVGDIFGHEIVYRMAIVMLGGLVTSTLFSLFIVPALYMRFAPVPETAPSRSQLSISQQEVAAS